MAALAGPWSRTTSTTVAPLPSASPANDQPASSTSPSVSPPCREPANPAVPLPSTTWPAASSTDGAAAAGLATIHHTGTACPAGSLLGCTETATPRSLRTNLQLPTSTDSAGGVTIVVTGLVLTGLVVGPPRRG